MCEAIHLALDGQDGRGWAMGAIEVYDHRERLGLPLFSAAVTRTIPANSPEFCSEGCKKAALKEVSRLRGIDCWLENIVS